MPYARASDTRPETLIEEWRGTCSGKHLLLAALLQELGHDSMLITALHEFTPRNAPWLPPHLLAEVERAPVPDVHNFLMVDDDSGWFAVDATWPLAARALGLPANQAWTPGRNMTVAADVDGLWRPGDEDPIVLSSACSPITRAAHPNRGVANASSGSGAWLGLNAGRSRTRAPLRICGARTVGDCLRIARRTVRSARDARRLATSMSWRGHSTEAAGGQPALIRTSGCGTAQSET
jgi:hypothetical protein